MNVFSMLNDSKSTRKTVNDVLPLSRYCSRFDPNFVLPQRFVFFNHDYFGSQLTESTFKSALLRIGCKLDYPRSFQYSNVITSGTIMHGLRDSVPVRPLYACCYNM